MTFLLQDVWNFSFSHLLTALLLFSGVRSSSASSHQPRLTTTTWVKISGKHLEHLERLEKPFTPGNTLNTSIHIEYLETTGNTSGSPALIWSRTDRPHSALMEDFSFSTSPPPSSESLPASPLGTTSLFLQMSKFNHHLYQLDISFFCRGFVFKTTNWNVCRQLSHLAIMLFLAAGLQNKERCGYKSQLGSIEGPQRGSNLPNMQVFSVPN